MQPSVEDCFILLTARLQITNRAAVKELMQHPGLHWDEVGQKASQHRVDTLIYPALKEAGLLPLLPQELQQFWHLKYLQNALKFNDVLLREAKMMSQFCPNDTLVLLKGSALQLTLYPDLGRRQQGDIDLLVDVNRVEAVREQLLSSGRWFSHFHPGDKSPYHKQLRLQHHKHLLYIHSKKEEYAAEIHWKFYRGERDMELAAEAIRTARKVHDCWVMSPEMQLLHLCSNFAYGLYMESTHEYLRGLCDIREWVRSQSIDWTLVQHYLHLSTELYESVSACFGLLKRMYGEDFVVPKDLPAQNYPCFPSLDWLCSTKPVPPQENVWQKLHPFSRPQNNLCYLYRELIPERRWLHRAYPKSKMPLLSYWTYMIRRYLLKQHLQYGQ